MSQPRITLRPPPNVEFVVGTSSRGYPGIPAGHDRPHAEVRGTIELRLGTQGIKAKWVRVELKKVETLPGGGQSNTFYDFVGQSPVKVWEAQGEWSVLHTQDLPFAIRIPESIPPSIALEKGAGIRYELNAALCLKGKKGWFFKKVDPTLSTSHPMVIDKHELHSTWPVYAQPESRHVVDELLILTVDRTNTCYGPGDRVKVLATFKNDGIPAAPLRAFEFLLKETIIFRAGPHVSGKKGAPQVHVSPIGEQKVPVNKTVYQGQQHRAELGCFIPQTHTTTSVSAARHIDIAYSINVKAVLATGKPLLIELPVTVSNWPRNMSIEAVRRIGPSPNLSLIAPMNIAQRLESSTVRMTRPNLQSQIGANQSSNYNTAPGRSNTFQVQLSGVMQSNVNGLTASQYGDPVAALKGGYDEFGLPSAVGSGPSQSIHRTTSAALTDDFGGEYPRRPPMNANPHRRLTLANAEMDSEPDSPTIQASPPKKFMSALEEKILLQNALGDTPGGSGSSSTANPIHAALAPSRSASSHQRTAWPTAEEEKQRLFNNARQQALRTQAIMGNYQSPMPTTLDLHSAKPDGLSLPIPTLAPASKKSTPWPTAEEEKLRLFSEAQNAVRRVQSQGLYEGLAGGSNAGEGPPPATNMQFDEVQVPSPDSSNFANSTAPYSIRQPAEAKPTGAQIYQHAMATMSRNPSAQASVPQPVTEPSPPPSKPSGPPGGQSGRRPTAEEEKAALRYYEAKRAVDRAQQHIGCLDQSSSLLAEEPIAYDALYPSGPSPDQTKSSQLANGSRHRMPSANGRDGSFLPTESPPGSPPPVPSSTINSALSEKERLRLKYQAEDAAATAAAGSRPSPPPRAAGPGSRGSPPGYGRSSSSRSQPLPPADFSGSRPLTAAEEKARLRVQHEAEDAAAALDSNGGAGPSTAAVMPLSLSPGHAPIRMSSVSYANNKGFAPPEEFVPPPPPPPLAPRPPAEYIQETKEEDARTQAEDHALSGVQAKILGSSHLNPNDDESRMDFGLSFRPFSPFDLGLKFDSINKSSRMSAAHTPPPPPPPLPPKVPISQ